MAIGDLCRKQEWSFRPILIWFRCIGIDLIESSEKKLDRIFWLLYSISCFLLNLAVEVDILNFLKNPELYITGGAKLETATSSWNATIDFVNYAAHSVGSHLILLAVVRPRLKRLLHVMHRCNSQRNFYTKLYRLSIFGVIYIFLIVCHSLIYYTGYYNDEYMTIWYIIDFRMEWGDPSASLRRREIFDPSVVG